MEELIELLKAKGDEQIIGNLIMILKNNYGVIRKYKLTKKNYRLQYLGETKERELIFWHDVLGFEDKYPRSILLSFYGFWSEITPDGKKMKWERETTWEISKRLAWWNSHQYNKY